MKRRTINASRSVSLQPGTAVLFVSALFAALLPAQDDAEAHHSNAMFDKSLAREERVTVKEFQWTNPHIWIQVIVDGEDGEAEEWSIEGGGPNTLFRKGWRPNSFRAGDVVEIRFYPMHDGSRAGLFVAARFADGSTLGDWQELRHE